ncbi:hypothetical protein AKUH1B104J_11380 [Apilactobacillus kunkeei]|nr:hypothetical protein AKUH1B104J_11380 [Apilactobacillus kunkeei]
MIKVKNVLLTALVATFMMGGIVSVEEASVNANAQTVQVHHAKKNVKKHAVKKHAKKNVKKHAVKKHAKKHAKKNVKKHVKKSAKKHVRKVAKKHVAKKIVCKAAKKHVAKKVATKKITKRVANTDNNPANPNRVANTDNNPANPNRVANTDNNPANPLARNNKRVPLPQDTDYVGYVYTYGRGVNSAEDTGRVAPYLKQKAVREDGMTDYQWATAQFDAKNQNDMGKNLAQQCVFLSYGGDIREKLNTNYNAYQAAAQKYGWKLTNDVVKQ